MQHLSLLESGVQLLLQVLKRKKHEHQFNRQHLLNLHTVAVALDSLISDSECICVLAGKKKAPRLLEEKFRLASCILLQHVMRISSVLFFTVNFMLLDIFFYDFCFSSSPSAHFLVGIFSDPKNQLQRCWCFFSFRLSTRFHASHVLYWHASSDITLWKLRAPFGFNLIFSCCFVS